VLLDTVFEKGVTYHLRISGTVDISPGASRIIDPVYCIKSAVGTSCTPPYVVGGVQLTWYRGTGPPTDATYSHWTVFLGGKPTTPSATYTYDEAITPEFDARIKVGVSGYDTDPADNTGSFEVTVIGPAKEPPAGEPSCAKNDWRYGPDGEVVALTKAVKRSLKIVVSGKQPCPAKATVASGATVTICNQDPFADAFYSPSKHNRWNVPPGGRTDEDTLARVVPKVRTGRCTRFKVRNPTGAPLEMKIFDVLHERFKIVLRIQPG
jgi:hypothetical protein